MHSHYHVNVNALPDRSHPIGCKWVFFWLWSLGERGGSTTELHARITVLVGAGLIEPLGTKLPDTYFSNMRY